MHTTCNIIHKIGELSFKTKENTDALEFPTLQIIAQEFLYLRDMHVPIILI